MRVLNAGFDQPMDLEERAAASLAGGLMEGYQCGHLWGAALAAGAQAYRILGPGLRAETTAVIASQRIMQAFRKRNRNINCRELTGIDIKSAQSQAFRTFVKMFVEGKIIRCFSLSASTARIAFREINATLSKETPETPAAPVSFAAVLAQKLGLSDVQTVMAAGFAGGIGLSGGACGALGTAFWALGMSNVKGRVESIGFEIPGASALIGKFANASGHEFECGRIVGRQFEDINDHARYVAEGGCSKIVEILATPAS